MKEQNDISKFKDPRSERLTGVIACLTAGRDLTNGLPGQRQKTEELRKQLVHESVQSIVPRMN
jgi:hypothetical protein